MAATITLSATTVLENPTAGTIIGTLGVTESKGQETFTYTLADSIEGRFEIREVIVDGVTTYVLAVKSGDGLFDFEDDALKEFSISISAVGSKDTAVDTASFTINVTDNTAPTDVTLSNTAIFEHAATGAEVGSLLAIDPDLNDSFTFELVDDAEGRFDIVDGKLVVEDGSKLDFLTASSHQVTVKVTDADGNVLEKTLTIGVKDAFDYFQGSSKNNKIVGTAGADWIDGGNGNDRLYGLGGDDVLIGGGKKDYLVGGTGKDTFVFNNAVKKGHFDHIADFNSADDTIQISLSALKAFKVKVAKKEVYESLEGKKSGNKKGFYSLDKVFEKGKLEKKFFSSSKAKDTYDFVTYDKKNGFVYLDLDGSGGNKGFVIAKLKPGTYVQADDFLFV